MPKYFGFKNINILHSRPKIKHIVLLLKANLMIKGQICIWTLYWRGGNEITPLELIVPVQTLKF